MATITTTTSLSFDAAASLTVGVDKNFEGSIAFTSANDDVWPSFTVTKPQSKIYGPFGIAMTVVITVGNGSLDYTINGGMGGFGYDTNGNVESLVSGDGVLPFSWCLGAQHTAVTAPADTAENTLYSLTIPAGTMGLNDTLRISTLSTVTNSGNNKTLRVAFGGSNVSTIVVTTSAAVKTQHQLSNRNSLSSQIMGGATSGLSYGPSGVSALAVGTLSVDTSAAQTLTVTGQKATGAEVFTLESVVVELIRGPA